MWDALFSFFRKKDSTQVFYCEYCKIFKFIYFEEHLRAAAFVKNDVLKIFWKTHKKKHLYQSLFLNKFAGFQTENLRTTASSLLF